MGVLVTGAAVGAALLLQAAMAATANSNKAEINVRFILFSPFRETWLILQQESKRHGKNREKGGYGFLITVTYLSPVFTSLFTCLRYAAA